MKRWLLALALFASAASVAMPQMGEVVPAWKLKLKERLAQRTSVAFQSTPLTEALQILRETLKVNIVLDAADAAAGERLITLNLQDVQADRILTWVTQQAGLEYALANEAVYISAPERTRAIEPRTLASYEVTDVIYTPEVLAAIGTNNGSSNNTNSSSSSSNSNSNNSGNNNSGFSNANAGNDLLSLIVTLTGPENWDQVAVLGTTNNSNSANDNSSKENLF